MTALCYHFAQMPHSEEAVPGQRGGEELLRILAGRDAQHAAEANDVFAKHAPNVALALRFIRTFLEGREIHKELLFANEAAVLLLYGRVYQQLRAATFLAVHGYYSEVWGLLRAVYECASLARYLSKKVERADSWVRRGVWIREKEVHRTTRDAKEGFDELYRLLSDMTHPTLRSSAIFVDQGKDDFAIDLQQPYIERVFVNCLEITDAVALWACFALKNCLPSPAFMPPSAQYTLEALAHLVAPKSDWSHLRRNWEEAISASTKKARSMRSAAEIDEAMRKYVGPIGGTDLPPPAQGVK